MLYGAEHGILPVREPAIGEPLAPVDVVGPICESTDVFARGRSLPRLDTGDLVAFTGAGAYGAVMASNYNSRPTAVEVMVNGARAAVVKPRREPEDQFADERVPGWLDGGDTPGDAA
jgi:diaminopimelate decarboxylase